MIRGKLANKLTKKLQAHLTECGINSIQSLKNTLIKQERDQAEAEKKHGKDIPFFLCRCGECHEVARRLGIDVKKLMEA